MSRRRSGRLRPACPHPDKLCYGEAEAVRVAALRGRGIRVALRAYRCPCGWWHLTSKPRRPGG